MKSHIFDDCLECWKNARDGQPFWQELADKYGQNKNTLRTAFTRERKKRGIHQKDQIDAKRVHSISGKNTDGTYSSDRLVEIFDGDLNDDVALLKAHNVDPTKFALLSSISNMWHMLRSDDRGRVIQFQSKIRFEPIKLKELTVDAITEFYKDKNFITNTKFPKFTPSNKRVLETCPSDYHIGSRYFDKNYSDLEEIYPRMMADVFHRIENDKRGFTKIIYAPLGDVFHYENRQQQTARHQQVVDGNGMNPLEMYDVALGMFSSTIDRLLTYAPVELIYIPGNHDGISLYHLCASMAERYRDVKTFSVDLGHSDRKSRLIGKNLLGLEHGEMPKKNRIHWLAIEASEKWGKSMYRETHSGHLHHEEVIEHGGVKTRRLSGITSTDYWHHSKGYEGAIRATMSFVWDEERLGWTDMWQSTGM